MVENTTFRAMHDLGLAAWFGGSMMGAAGLNRAAEEQSSDTETARLASVGWKKWSPINAAAIGMHLVGGAALAAENWRRVGLQKGVLASTLAKSALTAAALATTAYTRALGKKLELASSPDADKSAKAEQLPMSVDAARRRLAMLQWAVPALTGAIEVLNSLHGEQQRPSRQFRGRLSRLVPAF
ncbi:MAG TPA: hypothetical protein VIL34_19270 [Actinopolymorphaceae bacterium]|jgi:hypothetical protein